MIAGNREACMEEVLLVETRGALRLLTLNRPKEILQGPQLLPGLPRSLANRSMQDRLQTLYH